MENQEKTNQTQTIKTVRQRISTSTTFRMAIIGLLTIILMIPMIFVNNMVRDRKYHKKNVIAEINQSWGQKVELFGPVLKIPYKTYRTVTRFDSKGRSRKIEEFTGYQYLFVFPEELNIEGNIIGEPKKIGIYKSAVYKAKTKIDGNFVKPNFKKLDIDEKHVDWEKAEILFKTTNSKGIEDKIVCKWQGKDFRFNLQGGRLDTYYTFKTDFLGMEKFDNKPIHFEMNYNAKGSKSFYIIPIGNQTKVHLTSNWKDTKFTGEFLPGNKDKITKDGFDAHWKIIDYQRAFGQQHQNNLPTFRNYAFGVNFIISVDEYLKADRATKYAFLVIFLTFIVFFIIQNVGKIEIHTFQYFLIGLALVIFYTLLVSISEHTNFNFSYLISSFATIMLITLYAKAILNQKKFTLYIFTSLVALYGYIFVIIQLEKYALLVGSIGLFVILAVIMYFSRKIKW